MVAVFKMLLAAAILMGSWLAIPSSLFFRPTSVAIEGTTVTVARTFPMRGIFGPPWIRYVETVRRIERPSQPCTDTNAFRYDATGGTGSWDIGPWAKTCMVAPYHWRASWRVYLFDLIPLRPVEMDLLVKPGAEADG